MFHRRIKIAVAVPQSALADLFAETEYFSCNVTISNQKTVGTGACTGCSVPACVVLNSVNVVTALLTQEFLGTATTPGSNLATWQGQGPNCLQVSARPATWGQLKALYR